MATARTAALPIRVCVVLGMLLLAGCPSGGGGGTASTECSGDCATVNSFLSVAQLQTILSQAVAEANARGARATIAVVDRVGNVLAVFRMTGAQQSVTITSGRSPPVSGGLEGASVPDTLAAIAKAITAAYLSTEGNAFSTRTANQIIQEHFNPGELNQPGGPLFGVQFSNLPCSDLNTRLAGGTPGPKRSPLGFSADAGGLPLYIGGTPVGAIGVIADGVYGLDLNINDTDNDLDEFIALAGTFGFAAPSDRTADKITVDGKQLRFSDATGANLLSDPANAPAFGPSGALVAVPLYFNGTLVAGTAFGEPASGIRADTLDYPGRDAFVLVDNANSERFRPTATAGGLPLLTENEVRTIIQSGLDVANISRAQIRRPLGSTARVSISVVDTDGNILGIARSRDAPIFGIDVSLQKARTAAFFSNASAGTDLTNVGPGIGAYVTAAQSFLGLPTALSDGAFAFSDRAGGNLSRPYFPDGLVGTPNGPFSKAFSSWSPFSNGLQLDLVAPQIAMHLAGGDPTNCTTIGRLANGIQIFPGSVPIYRGNTLVGGLGVSGDGVDQDDLISFLGLNNAAVALGTVNNAPVAIRADNITVPGAGVNLRFVQCPQTPFVNSNQQNVCAGL